MNKGDNKSRSANPSSRERSTVPTGYYLVNVMTGCELPSLVLVSVTFVELVADRHVEMSPF